jgi:hypothetical protein
VPVRQTPSEKLEVVDAVIPLALRFKAPGALIASLLADMPPSPA